MPLINRNYNISTLMIIRGVLKLVARVVGGIVSRARAAAETAEKGSRKSHLLKF